MRILLAVDESWASSEELEVMMGQLRPNGCEVRVLHVLQPIAISPPPQMASDYAPELQEFGKRAKELLENIERKLRAAGFKAESLVQKGDVRATILDEAEEWKADLIVLGSKGAGAARRFLLGSVADSVSRHAHCSVEIVRPTNHR